MQRIKLDFKTFTCEAELFDTDIARRFAEHLPYEVSLTNWGKELYGPIEVNLGEENPVPVIPHGGIAYTSRGDLVCIFYGQTPAWPVEYIGKIVEGDIKNLEQNEAPDSVIIQLL